MIEPRPNIWQMQSQHDVEHLVEALAHPDADVRRRAVMALRSLDAVGAVPALKSALARENDLQLRVSLLVAIQVLDTGSDTAVLAEAHDVQGLIHALQGRDPEQVISAARSLGELGDRIAVEPLVILFHNPAALPAVRLAAAEALLELRSAPAVVTLLGALRRESWEVRRNSAAVLGQIQATWAVTPLTAALDDRNPLVRRTAAAALHRIGTEEAMAALRRRFGGQPVPTHAGVTTSIPVTTAPPQTGDPTGLVSLPAPVLTKEAGFTPIPETVSVSVPALDVFHAVSAEASTLSEQVANERIVLDLAEAPTRPHDLVSPLQPGLASPDIATLARQEPEREERAALLARPVNRLIAFLRARD